MPRLMKLTRGSKPLQAPNWVADAMEGATLIGHGGYARVFRCKDGSALKITTDAATISLASRLARSPLPGFAPVWRTGALSGSRQPCMAVSMPKLTHMNRWQLESVRSAYRESLVAACRLHGFQGVGHRAARLFAQELARSAMSAPTSSFSACLCAELAARCLPNAQGRQLRKALAELASFCELRGFDVDLMGLDNWMVDDRGRLVLSDPVVIKAYDF